MYLGSSNDIFAIDLGFVSPGSYAGVIEMRSAVLVAAF